MSGDVQPRKRRDKKKKKDEVDEGPPIHFHARASTPPTTSDEVIHVYKETSTGGGICAKVVFFILLSILAVLIGLIITEHRGLTDLDTIEAETRFSQIFEGWVDKAPEDDHHDVHFEHDDDHDEAHDDDAEHDDEHDDDDDDHASEEEEEEEEVEASEEEEPADETEEEEEEEAPSAADDDDEDEEEDSRVQDDDADDEDSEPAVSEQDDDDDDDEKSAPASEEVEDSEGKGDDDDEDDDEKSVGKDDDDDEDDDDDKEEAASTEEAASVEEKGDVDDADDDEDENGDDDDKSEEAVANKDDDEDGDDDAADDDDGDDEEDGEEPVVEVEDGDQANVGVKVGVGVAIVVVAYVVLVRKWKSDKIEQDGAPTDLSRRNTIVVPPRVEEVVDQVVNDDDEGCSDDEEEEIPPIIKGDYKKLRTTYQRSLTPDSEPENPDDEYDDEGDVNIDYDEEELEDEEDVEDVDEEEEEAEPEEPEEEEELSDEPDDEELMRKLEAKYGKLQAGGDDEEEGEYEPEEEEEEEDNEDEPAPWKRDKPSGAKAESDDENQAWVLDSVAEPNADITNEEDAIIKEELDYAQETIPNSVQFLVQSSNNTKVTLLLLSAQISRPSVEAKLLPSYFSITLINNAALAMRLFNDILSVHPKSPRGLYGKASSLDIIADQKRSNQLLAEAIEYYTQVMELPKVPLKLVLVAGDRSIQRLRFIGHYAKAIKVHMSMIKHFAQNVTVHNQMVVTYLLSNRINEARELLKDILKKWPGDGFAQAHYGFILKVHDNNLELGAKYLKKGIESRANGVIDGRFYFHLGDALSRLGKPEEAIEVYNDGVKNKLFHSTYQRSLYNVAGLKAQPWWQKTDTPSYQQFYDIIERNYKNIRDEALAILNSTVKHFQDETENLRESGIWQQFELYARGLKNQANCKKVPFTCKLLEMLPDATGCRRGQIKFSILHPNTHVWPHCGPTNCRLRVHLGLIVPPKTFIRVGKEIRSWIEGEVIIFDDSFEHEVWNNSTRNRLVLIIDVWHPDLTYNQKRSLSAI